jgi:hypothetical protein
MSKSKLLYGQKVGVTQSVKSTPDEGSHIKMQREWLLNNPVDKDAFNKRLNTPSGVEEAMLRVKDPKAWQNKVLQETKIDRDNKSKRYVADKLYEKSNGAPRGQWLDSLSQGERDMVLSVNHYKPNMWQETATGIKSLLDKNEIDAVRRIYNDSYYSKQEKDMMFKDYKDSPVMSKITNATKVLNPLLIPGKGIQGLYKEGYSLFDGLSGKQNDASFVEDVVTDPLTYVGIGGAMGLGKKTVGGTVKAVNAARKEKAFQSLVLQEKGFSANHIPVNPNSVKNSAVGKVAERPVYGERELTKTFWSLMDDNPKGVKADKKGLVNISEARSALGKEKNAKEKLVIFDDIVSKMGVNSGKINLAELNNNISKTLPDLEFTLSAKNSVRTPNGSYSALPQGPAADLIKVHPSMRERKLAWPTERHGGGLSGWGLKENPDRAAVGQNGHAEHMAILLRNKNINPNLGKHTGAAGDVMHNYATLEDGKLHLNQMQSDFYQGKGHIKTHLVGNEYPGAITDRNTMFYEHRLDNYMIRLDRLLKEAANGNPDKFFKGRDHSLDWQFHDLFANSAAGKKRPLTGMSHPNNPAHDQITESQAYLDFYKQEYDNLSSLVDESKLRAHNYFTSLTPHKSAVNGMHKHIESRGTDELINFFSHKDFKVDEVGIPDLITSAKSQGHTMEGGKLTNPNRAGSHEYWKDVKKHMENVHGSEFEWRPRDVDKPWDGGYFYTKFPNTFKEGGSKQMKAFSFSGATAYYGLKEVMKARADRDKNIK